MILEDSKRYVQSEFGAIPLRPEMLRRCSKYQKQTTENDYGRYGTRVKISRWRMELIHTAFLTRSFCGDLQSAQTSYRAPGA